MEPKMISISQDEFNRLVEARNILEALEAAGVDNWEWYGDAIKTLEEKEGE